MNRKLFLPSQVMTSEFRCPIDMILNTGPDLAHGVRYSMGRYNEKTSPRNKNCITKKNALRIV